MVQPDLGTAMMVLLGGGGLLFVAGVRLWMFLGAAVAAVSCLPLACAVIHAYQRKRVLSFLDPHRAPLGAGYPLTQPQIAVVSARPRGRSGEGSDAGRADPTATRAWSVQLEGSGCGDPPSGSGPGPRRSSAAASRPRPQGGPQRDGSRGRRSFGLCMENIAPPLG